MERNKSAASTWDFCGATTVYYGRSRKASAPHTDFHVLFCAQDAEFTDSRAEISEVYHDQRVEDESKGVYACTSSEERGLQVHG